MEDCALAEVEIRENSMFHRIISGLHVKSLEHIANLPSICHFHDVGKGADPKKPWKEDNELEEVLAAVHAEFEVKKQSEKVMDQKLINSANSSNFGVFCVVGLIFQTIAHR